MQLKSPLLWYEVDSLWPIRMHFRGKWRAYLDFSLSCTSIFIVNVCAWVSNEKEDTERLYWCIRYIVHHVYPLWLNTCYSVYSIRLVLACLQYKFYPCYVVTAINCELLVPFVVLMAINDFIMNYAHNLGRWVFLCMWSIVMFRDCWVQLVRASPWKVSYSRNSIVRPATSSGSLPHSFWKLQQGKIVYHSNVCNNTAQPLLVQLTSSSCIFNRRQTE